MNQKSYQDPIVRVIALPAAAIICSSPSTYNRVSNGTQYSRSTGSWDDEEE